MNNQRKTRRKCSYWTRDWELREGEAVERNGNLTWIEDSETGKGDWLPPHEIGEAQ